MNAATERLPRLLALVPWLLAHPGSKIEDVAAEFGITTEELDADLDLIWVCGLPGHGPGDLIDVTRTPDRVTLSNADTISMPLRLTTAETVAIVAGLRMLSTLPGIADAGAVDRALAKLEASTGGGAEVADRVLVAPPGQESGDDAVAGTLREALMSSRRVRIDYWVPARDEVTTREVDPIRIRTDATTTYLIGWCRLVDDVRTFRFDRVVAAVLLDVAAQVPPEAADAGLGTTMFTPDAADRVVVLEVGPSGRWVIDYYPTESVEERADGTVRVSLRAADDAWVIRLALGLAGEGRIVEPIELAERVRVIAREARAAYS